MKIENPRYRKDQGHPYLEVAIDGKLAQIYWEMKPGIVRQGLVFLGPNFTQTDLGAEIEGRPLLGFTGDRTVFRLAIAFGLECYYDRFQVGPAREQPDPEEVKELGKRLAEFALPSAPDWAELTNF
jgi:hypothetical protein